MKARRDKTTEKESKKASPELLAAFKSALASVHPALPAYFAGRSGAIVPIVWGEDADAKMAELELTRLDPDGHIDKEVLWAIYEIFAEADDGFWSPYHPQRAVQLVAKALRNPNSKLSIAIAKAYGQAQQP